MNVINKSDKLISGPFGRDRSLPAKAKRLHEILYRFSLEKLEEYFSNTALTTLFFQYMKHYENRLELSSVMAKSQGVYMSALKLVLIRTQHLI